MKLRDILVREFDSTGIKDTPHNYMIFVQEFAKQNNMTVLGKCVDGVGWDTEGCKFDTPEDELIFKLKFAL
jgi:hypothetical protein